MAMPIIAYRKIRPLRQAKGLRQAQVAAELGISRPTYVLVEEGAREPTISQLYTLARILGIEAGELCSNLPSLVNPGTDYSKFKELVSACINGGADQGAITKTKLALLCYLVDFAWYRLHAVPLTGMTYRCTLRGPVADDYFRVIDELYESQAIAIEPNGTALIIRPIEQRPSKALDKLELTLIYKITAKWRPESTEALINFVQGQAPYKSSKLGEPIVYESILNESEDALY